MATLSILCAWRARATATLLGAALSACAATSAAPPSPGIELALMVKLAQATGEPAEVVRRTQAIAGVPVRYRAASSPVWHAVTLNCPTQARCEQALQTLRQSPTMTAVELDRPVSIPSTPPSAAF